jgi:signal transduction histidine kinase
MEDLSTPGGSVRAIPGPAGEEQLVTKPSLRQALLRPLLLGGILFGLLGIVTEYIHHRRTLEAQQFQYADSLALSITSAAATLKDDAELREFVGQILSEAEVSAAALFGGEPPRVLAGSGISSERSPPSELFGSGGLPKILKSRRQTSWYDPLLDRRIYVFPVGGSMQRLSSRGPFAVVLQLDAGALRRGLWARTASVASFVIVVLMLLGIVMRRVVDRSAVGPLVKMADAVARQAAGDAEAPVPSVFASEEFANFGGLLHDMIHTRNVASRELMRSEAELRLLGQITRIADRARDFDEALRGCCAQICRFMLWPMGHVCVVDEDDRSLLHPSNIWHVSCPELATEFVENTSLLNPRQGEDLSGRVLERKEPVWVEDCWAEEWFTRSNPDTGMIRAAAGFPIFMAQDVVAVLELFDIKPREREVRPMALMHNIGLTLGQVLQRRRNHELLVRRNKELVEAMKVAVRATNAKSEFLANMSHEIRTPLTAIIGYADLLESASGEPERAEFLSTIRRNSEHLLQLINAVLDVSKIEAGRFEVERIECSPAELMRSVVDAMAPPARAKDLDFAVRWEGPLPERIVTDPTRVNQVLLNLISNAIKFTLQGRVEVLAELATTPDHENPMLRFRIKDTGIGISESQLEKIFRPFSQADMSTTRRFGGTGLGLSISRNLARLLGGELRAESTLGKGSIFDFTIQTGPLEDVAMLDAPTVSSPSVGGQLAEDQIPRLDDVRILLAEDGEDNQRLITKILSSLGAKVEVAENGAIACERALEAQSSGEAFDAILMDMQMPVMDGYSASMNLRQQGYRRPIIALTANSMKGDREKCLAAGCDDFISKPVKRALLSRAVAEALDLE